jgi:predicted DNA binding CopG/RHH family protein
MGMIDREQQLERIAADYETGDASAELDRADYDGGAVAEPMVTISLRLPKPVMDAVRAAADARGMRPTALMREWVEQQVVELATVGEQVIPVSAVIAFLAETAMRHTTRQAS